MHLFPKQSLIAIACMLLLTRCGGGGGTPYQPDPLRDDQWHLTGKADGSVLAHLNLDGVVEKGFGIIVGIIDDGMDIDHEDLKANVLNFNRSYLPPEFAFGTEPHGTAVAGLIAAVEGNGKGGRGVAPNASLIAYNVLRAPAMSNFADAMTRDLDRVSIYNNSWGDFNGWGDPIPLRSVVEAALRQGTAQGRGGLGSNYIFSAGNGALSDTPNLPADNVNFSGLVNNRYTIAVCAVDSKGKKSLYSEAGATLWVCAPSSQVNTVPGVVTTDGVGDDGFNTKDTTKDYNNKSYTSRFGGTSAAAPMVSGVVALMLEANPSLSWRDVKAVLARSTTKNDPTDADWFKTAAGLWVNHAYGFGLIDVKKAVTLAKTWVNLSVSTTTDAAKTADLAIPDNNEQGVISTVSVGEDLAIEFIDITVNIPDHPKLSDLEIVLTAPSGTQSVLSELHKQQFDEFRLNNWRFGSARHLGESSKGVWTLQVKDKRTGGTGTLKDWAIKVHGVKVQPETPSFFSRLN